MHPFSSEGGVTYLYCDTIKAVVGKHSRMVLLACILLSIVWFLTPANIGNVSIMMLKNLMVFLPWLWYSISVDSKLLSNTITKRLSRISLEIYLAQMIIFRGFERVFGLYFAGDGWLGFLLVWIIVICGLIIFVELWKYAEATVIRRKSKE